MKAEICLFALKRILDRRSLSFFSRYPLLTSKLNVSRYKPNQLRLVSNLHDNDFTHFEKLLDKPEVKNFLKLVGEEYDKIEKLNNHRSPVSAICSQIKAYNHDLETYKTLNPENDKEMQKLIDLEEKNILREINQLRSKLISYVMEAEDDCEGVMFSVVPGLGGQEAKLFAEELFFMYLKYASYKGWEIAQLDKSNAEGGGINRAEAAITGKSVYKFLKHEAGIHRVQRVPKTEKNGKMQTSTCKINVVPDIDPGKIILNQKDLKFETTTSCGPGGQNVNKVETCVRVTYIPTGLTVESQTSRYQAENRVLAIKKLKNMLYQEQYKEIKSTQMNIKLEQAATINRSDKIRTYNFMHDRVTDHRINYSTHHVGKYMEGNKLLDEMVEQLDINYKMEYLLRNINRMLDQRNVSNLFKNKES